MKKNVFLFFLVVFAAAIFIFGYININSLPLSNDQTNQTFVINQGEGLRQISTRLAKNKLIKNDLVFLLLAHKLGLNNKLQAGLFKLSPALSTAEIIQKLSQGKHQNFYRKRGEENPCFFSSLLPHLQKRVSRIQGEL